MLRRGSEFKGFEQPHLCTSFSKPNALTHLATTLLSFSSLTQIPSLPPFLVPFPTIDIHPQLNFLPPLASSLSFHTVHTTSTSALPRLGFPNSCITHLRWKAARDDLSVLFWCFHITYSAAVGFGESLTASEFNQVCIL